MNQSEQINELSPAIVAAQAAGLIVVARNKNSQTNSQYADLADIATSVLPVLSDHKVSVLQFIGSIRQEGEIHVFGVTTRLLHASGQYLEQIGEFPLASPPVSKSGNQILNWSQNHGLAITYARRYALVSALGIAIGSDDDAQKLLSALQTGPGQEPVYAPHWSALIRGKWDGELVEGYKTPLGEMSTEEKRELIRMKLHLKSPALAAFLYDSASSILDECGMIYEDAGHSFPSDPMDMTPGEIGALFTFAKSTQTRISAEKAAAAGEVIP